MALNAVLAAALAVIAWQAWSGWKQAQITRRNNLDVKVKPVPAPPLTPAPKPEAAPASKFEDVATKDLFSKDRNPNIVIEQPKVEPPKPMPPLPVVFGVLGLPSGTKAIMAERTGAPSRPVSEGDKVGDFMIASLDLQTIVFDWDGKKISRKVDDLIDRSNTTAAVGPAVAAVSPNPGAAAAPPPQPAYVKPGRGKDTGGGYFACNPGDSSPAGTVVDGYRKNVVKSPFGESCNWTQAQ